MTLVELGQEWLLSDHAHSLSPETLKNMTGTIEKHIMRWIGTARIEFIDAPYVKEWQRDLRKAGVTPDPMARALKYLKMLLNYAVEEGYLQGNPAQVVKPPKKPPKEPRTVLSPRQVEAVIEQMEREQDRLYARLMAYAGLRPQEAHSLTWDRVQERSLIIRAPKTNRIDTVKVYPFLIEDLEAWRAASRPAKRNSAVFGGPWSKTRYDNWRTRVFDPAAVAAGWGTSETRRIPRRTITDYKATITPYTFRHSFASMLLRSGIQPVDVAARMRHNVETTLADYAHVIADVDPEDTLTLPDAILESRKLTIYGHGVAV
jgi:integrase